MTLVSAESPDSPSCKQDGRVSTLSTLNSFSEQEMRFASKLRAFSNRFLDGGEVVGSQFHCAVRCAGHLGIIFSLTHLQNIYHLEGLVDPQRSELVGQKLHEARSAAFISLKDLLHEANSVDKVLASTVRTVLQEAPYGLALAFASPQGMSARERVSIKNTYRDYVRILLEDAQNLLEKHVCPCCRTIVRVERISRDDQEDSVDGSRVAELEKRVAAMKEKNKALKAKLENTEEQLVIKDADLEARTISWTQKISQCEKNAVSLRKDRARLEKKLDHQATICVKLNSLLEEVLGSTMDPEDDEEHSTRLSSSRRSEKNIQRASFIAANAANAAAAVASAEPEASSSASSQASDSDDTGHDDAGDKKGRKTVTHSPPVKEANVNLMRQKVGHHVAKVAGLRLWFSYKTNMYKKQVIKLDMDIKQLHELRERERKEFENKLNALAKQMEENMRRLAENHAAVVADLASRLEKAMSEGDSSVSVRELEMRVMKLEESETLLLAENSELREEINRLKLAIEELRFQLETSKMREKRRRSTSHDVLERDSQDVAVDSDDQFEDGVGKDRIGGKTTTRSVFLRLYEDARDRLIRLAEMQKRMRSATMEELLKVLHGVQKAFTIFPVEYLDNVDKICEHVLNHLAGRRTVSPHIPQSSDANPWLRRCLSASRKRLPSKEDNVPMILGSRILYSSPRLAPRRG
eukprot:GEMP01020857.1.p1 GENE.GEMP01020857.1~~GEMP01020857.1.p1  ORF type:complete len:710 (+),score=169.86 GEMP01020857.1:48-2132(+)